LDADLKAIESDVDAQVFIKTTELVAGPDLDADQALADSIPEPEVEAPNVEETPSDTTPEPEVKPEPKEVPPEAKEEPEPVAVEPPEEPKEDNSITILIPRKKTLNENEKILRKNGRIFFT
jgi:hypothetical protein